MHQDSCRKTSTTISSVTKSPTMFSLPLLIPLSHHHLDMLLWLLHTGSWLHPLQKWMDYRYRKAQMQQLWQQQQVLHLSNQQRLQELGTLHFLRLRMPNCPILLKGLERREWERADGWGNEGNSELISCSETFCCCWWSVCLRIRTPIYWWRSLTECYTNSMILSDPTSISTKFLLSLSLFLLMRVTMPILKVVKLFPISQRLPVLYTWLLQCKPISTTLMNMCRT